MNLDIKEKQWFSINAEVIESQEFRLISQIPNQLQLNVLYFDSRQTLLPIVLRAIGDV